MADKKIEIRIDIERLQQNVSVDDYVDLEDGKIRGIRNAVSWFILDDDGSYMDRKKALKLLGKLTLLELAGVGKRFVEAAEEAAAGGPKAPKESTGPTTPA